MTDAQWQEIDRIFEAALELSEDARHPWLTAECAGDHDLHRAVLRLLESDRKAESFLARPMSPALPLAPEPVDERGRRVGAYRLIEPISHGGMGSVYLAERDDDHYRRRVAIKLVRQGFLEEQLYQRFLLERQILAGLEHPYIARLYGGGETETGRPFLVMEFVEGLPIDRYCHEQGLDVRDRLELFRKVCTAVHYAHQNLLVHRDLKPANILVTQTGTPRLLDFGIAKALTPNAGSSELTTGAGLRPMTPGYASPEQIRGKAISTSSDVYALGVLLYELLTGVRPHEVESQGLHELERAICDQPPTAPSQRVRSGRGFMGLQPKDLARRLAGDLDTITLTALRKEPERRYASAQELADDLGRHLENLPVSARPDTFSYRAGKFLRRNRLAVGATTAALVALLAMATYVAITSTREVRRTALETQKTEQAMAYLLEVFKGTDPRQTGQGPPSTLKLLDDGTRQVGERFAGNPEMQATLFDAIGQVYTSLGYLERAKPLLIQALAFRRQHLEEAHPDVIESLIHLGELQSASGRPKEAIASYEEALDALLRQEEAAVPKINRVRQNLAAATLENGDLKTAERLQRQVLAALRISPETEGLEMSEAMNALGTILNIRNALDEAEALHRDALRIEEARLTDDHLTLASTREKLALVLIGSGRYVEAENLLRSCIAAREKALDREHPDLAQGLAHLAISLYYQGKLGEAEKLHRRSLSMVERRLGSEHPERATSLHNLGILQLSTGDLEAAEQSLRQAQAILQKVLGDDHLRTAKARSILALVLQRMGRKEEAQEIHDAILPVLKRTYDTEGLAWAHFLLQFGRSLLVAGDYEAAEAPLAKALENRRRGLSPDHWMVAETKGAYGVCLARLGRHAEARALLTEARPKVLENFGAENWRIRSIDATLAGLPKP